MDNSHAQHCRTLVKRLDEGVQRATANERKPDHREVARKVEEEARAARLAEQARLDAAVAAEREAILALRRAGRKAKKRQGR